MGEVRNGVECQCYFFLDGLQNERVIWKLNPSRDFGTEVFMYIELWIPSYHEKKMTEHEPRSAFESRISVCCMCEGNEEEVISD